MTERISKGERRQQALMGKQYCHFMGDNSAPDPGPAAAASEYAADKGFELGTAQQAESKRQYDLNYAALQPIIAQQSAIATTNAADAGADRAYNLSTYRPLEQSMVRDAETFNTAAEQERMAGRAGADVTTAFANVDQQQSRSLARMGVNPNSGKALALKNQTGIAEAAARAGAENNSRIQTRAEGQAMKVNAVGLGKGLTGAAQGAYGLALSAGNSAGTNPMAPGGQLLTGMNQGAGTIMQGANIQANGLTSMYSTDSQAASQAGSSMAGLAGAGIGAAAMIF